MAGTSFFRNVLWLLLENEIELAKNASAEMVFYDTKVNALMCQSAICRLFVKICVSQILMESLILAQD
jgi:uncharacterized HAD superfamily protein